jgi:hypothetical protein
MDMTIGKGEIVWIARFRSHGNRASAFRHR